MQFTAECALLSAESDEERYVRSLLDSRGECIDEKCLLYFDADRDFDTKHGVIPYRELILEMPSEDCRNPVLIQHYSDSKDKLAKLIVDASAQAKLKVAKNQQRDETRRFKTLGICSEMSTLQQQFKNRRSKLRMQALMQGESGKSVCKDILQIDLNTCVQHFLQSCSSGGVDVTNINGALDETVENSVDCDNQTSKRRKTRMSVQDKKDAMQWQDAYCDDNMSYYLLNSLASAVNRGNFEDSLERALDSFRRKPQDILRTFYQTFKTSEYGFIETGESMQVFASRFPATRAAFTRAFSLYIIQKIASFHSCHTPPPQCIQLSSSTDI
jgi:hypothetical protein